MDKPPLRSSSASGSYASRNQRDLDSSEEKLPPIAEDGLITVLQYVIHFAVKVLAVLMTLVILWGVADVVYVIYQRLMTPPFMLMTVTDILVVFGSFLSVLIAVEIFLNITVYLKYDALPIKMVIATALMAVARRVIMLDFKELDSPFIFAMAAVIIALGLTYWLISYKPKPAPPQNER
ncbi:phosphate-starvation-inducible PsiE family protein [Methylomonas sp. SURF-2]|uniref:Phosphate-starvation-inducible PsiE family protein n=1 Tax=Methylomonas subterranea TaxID=2952225 RepID=A0ABT1TJK1_9GAMM|nr:phosphate-starvation-inducible PsiE family protein [Methylomonas sp. SURF-2]MCQ8105423.1 phosphate-starvation-inducible PsiE family protein [Methylomonas sp. SURF-2]